MLNIANVVLSALVVLAGMASPSAQVTLTATTATTHASSSELGR